MRRRIKGGVTESRSRSRSRGRPRSRSRSRGRPRSRSRSRGRPRSRTRSRPSVPSTPSALLINNEKITSLIGDPPLKPNVNQGVSRDGEEAAARIMRAYKTALNNYRNAIRNLLREKRETDIIDKVKNIRKHQLSKELNISLEEAEHEELLERRMLRSRRNL